MKKYLIALIAGIFLSIESPAQGFFDTLNKAVNGLSRQSQLRNIRSNNDRQRFYEGRQSADNSNNRKDGSIRDKNSDVDNSDQNNRSGSFLQSNVNKEPEQKQSGVEPQSNEKVITLVVNGTGNAKEDAVKNALRSAIEQAFGTFVSANTEVLNDDLIKDEITTVSTGNIKSYKELSITQTSNGLYDASVQATVSIDQLTKFAQSKGMQAELAGAAFVMNMKMRELNKKNEPVAIVHMINKIQAIAEKGLFDYKLEIGEPKLEKDSTYSIKLKVLFCKNENTIAYYHTVYETLKALSLSEKERLEYSSIGLKYYCYNKNLELEHSGSGPYALRNELPNLWEEREVPYLKTIVVWSCLNYVISDNLGNSIFCKLRSIQPADNVNPLFRYINKGGKSRSYDNDCCVWFCLNKKEKRILFYELVSNNRIAPIWPDEYYPAIPLMNFESRDNSWFIRNDIIFNPNYISVFSDDERERENLSGVYYYQEFKVYYTEEELSKLTSIKIDRR